MFKDEVDIVEETRLIWTYPVQIYILKSSLQLYFKYKIEEQQL